VRIARAIDGGRLAQTRILNSLLQSSIWRPQQPGTTPSHPEQDRETGLRR
jgi:hypothetical protein